MKALRTQRWLAALAVMLLLTTSAMPALVRMTCLHSGHVQLSLGQAEDCCPLEEPADGATIEAACCEVDRAAPQRTEFNLETMFGLQIPTVETVLGNHALAALQQLSSPDGYFLSAHPPPRGVHERLSQVCSFLL